MKVGVIGAGRLGGCLATYLGGAGLLEAITASSEEKSARLAEQFGTEAADNLGVLVRSDVILLAVPDGRIHEVAEDLAARVKSAEGKTVLHTSGAAGLDVLASLKAKGAHVGSLHPLQSFAGGVVNLKGVYMALDGDALARKAAEELVKVFCGRPFFVPEKERAAYHAAACICSNYAVAVEALAEQLMSRWTGSRKAAWQALLPLFEGTAANLRKVSEPGQALTGPIARGDSGTVARHLEVLPDELKPAYCSLGLAAAQLALTNGTIDAAKARQLTGLLKMQEGL